MSHAHTRGTTLLCLHGWGGSRESFNELRAALQGSLITVLTPDLPGFGAEPEPATPWSNDDYATWVEKWLHTQHASKEPIHLLGHSHGGRIAIKLASRGNIPLSHLYLCATAGIQQHDTLKRCIGYALARAGNILFALPGLSALRGTARSMLYKALRVHDYERASPTMQQTMLKVREEDLKPILSSIHTPTDIFWGEDDRQTPIADAHVLKTRMPHATLHTYPGVRHAVHKARAQDIARVIVSSLPLRSVDEG